MFAINNICGKGPYLPKTKHKINYITSHSIIYSVGMFCSIVFCCQFTYYPQYLCTNACFESLFRNKTSYKWLQIRNCVYVGLNDSTSLRELVWWQKNNAKKNNTKSVICVTGKKSAFYYFFTTHNDSDGSCCDKIT